MADIDVSRVDRRVRREVERRGLVLVSPDPEPDLINSPVIFVSIHPDPNDCGFSRVGHVSTDLPMDQRRRRRQGRWERSLAVGLFRVCAMDGHERRPAVSIDIVRGFFPTWEHGILAVLDRFDQWWIPGTDMAAYHD